MGDRHKRDVRVQTCFEIETMVRMAEPSAADAWLDQFATRERIMNETKKTPDIAKMTMDELAEFVVGLDGWEWMPGMRVTFPRSKNGGGAAWVPETATLVYGIIKSRSDEAWSYCDVPGGCKPDLTDPATLGCLLAMVRKKHGEYAYTLPTGRGWRVLIGAPDERCVSVVSAKEEMPTEIRALVAALAKGEA